MNEIYFKDNAEVLKGLPDKSIDLILEDMPYNNTQLKFDYMVDLAQYWEDRLRVIKDNGAIVLTAQQPFTTDLIVSCRKLFRYEIIWEKTQPMGFLDANRKPLRSHENILLFYKKSPTYNPQKTFRTDVKKGRVRHQQGNRSAHYNDMSGGSYIEDGSRFPTSVLNISNWNGALFGNNSKATKHPTQKPVELFRWLIRTYTNDGDTVFDGYVGSGTTAIACIMEKRNFICCEWDENYFNNAKKRIEDAKLQKDFTLDL